MSIFIEIHICLGILTRFTRENFGSDTFRRKQVTAIHSSYYLF